MSAPPFQWSKIFDWFTEIRDRRALLRRVGVLTLLAVLAADVTDATINLLTQPARLWPSMVQTSFTAGVISLIFITAICRANFRLYKLKSEMERLSRTDLQTGILNRRGFFETAQARRGEAESSVLLLIDIDHFKRINDRYGHLAGDDVIGAVARHLGLFMDQRDVYGRVGGEEFAALLVGCNLAEARARADAIRIDVARAMELRLADGSQVTISVGIAAWAPDVPLLSGFAAADRALYAAKRAGRNRVAIQPRAAA
ncbi:GGDEF domain-containing protein [Mangrovibrevibacter kandeliae]|uniref:GGDEF domain-containing protein n=1 Tax=Mangrovibrevibacter kandeliae TaxID=2968473 RepID=UPI0021199926|nr:GGDEF domain-containing protein [Aurantimonas sp. CSK15Z-1]MCQ8781269.1 GGDEF domain-containing protein [Aurantimonas sp. CSK15Z-1]